MIEITKDYHSMSSASAEVFMEILEKKSNAVIGLAAGNSQKEMYGILASLPGFDERISKALFFNIDEYCDISLDRPGTCKYFIENNFISKTKIGGKQLLMLNQDSCSGFDGILEKLGGVDLMILGIGINGHIAYNEPGTAFGSGVHPQPIAEASKQQHGLEFGGIENVPAMAITCGIKTIMRSRHILLMASGEEKAGIIKASILGPVTEDVPCSVLQLHPNVDYILDKTAAGMI